MTARVVGTSRAASVLSIVALCGAAAASAATLAWRGAFPDPVPAPVFNGALAEARGWSLVTLVAALPTLALAMIAAARGSWRGRLAWPGALAYLFYTYLELAVSPPFTALYLIYVATFACAGSALVMVVVALDRDAIARALGPHVPRRSIAGFALATGVLLALAWLKGIVARTAGGDFGWPVGEAAIGHVVHALDLGLQVPLALATGVLLPRRAPAGAIAAAVMLVNAILMGAALTAMVAASALAAGTSVASAAPFAVLPAVAAGLAAGLFRAPFAGAGADAQGLRLGQPGSPGR